MRPPYSHSTDPFPDKTERRLLAPSELLSKVLNGRKRSSARAPLASPLSTKNDARKRRHHQHHTEDANRADTDHKHLGSGVR